MDEVIPPIDSGNVSLSERFFRLVTAFGAIAAAATVLTFGQSLWWVFELATSFRVQYLVVLTLVAVILIPARRFRLSFLFLLLGVVNIWCIRSNLIPFGTFPARGPAVLRAVAANVHTANKGYDLLLDYVRRTDPDFLVLTEMDDVWLEKCSDLKQTYAFHKAFPRPDNFGIVLFSKIPVASCEIVQFQSGGVPSIHVEVKVKGKSLHILGTHPLPPRKPDYAESWALQMEAMATFMKGIRNPKIVMGDLNTTPWSRHFQDLLEKAGMKDTSCGFGLQATWPTNFLPFRIPIDHILASHEIIVIDRKVGDWIGSDHYPVQLDFQLPD